MAAAYSGVRLAYVLHEAVAPCDRTHARWVHGVTSLTVVIAPG